ncbi:MAG: helix-turn-helix domain-containing protein [Cypionkella sp.]|jgi:HTH-type transcriptional regulator, cell division transcriptional repressor
MADISENTWFTDDVATFGDRLEAARAAADLSQEGLAERLGVRDTTVAAWEADEWEPRGNRLQMLAGMLNVSLMWLMTGRGAGLGGPIDEAALPLGARLALAEIAELREQLAETTAKLRRAEEKLDEEMKKVA